MNTNFFNHWKQLKEMVIIRDIVTDFSEDEDIELCDDDDTEGTEPGGHNT
ncbi:unnamed protein product [Lupinus luteus]|uniref:Uncharacterized protein n=1 Tax=Lupinus luteus TaxID=3873 RepID=A0AAV1WMV2_LUPLU